MIRPIAFIRWSRDAGWADTRGVIAYPFRTWKCRLFGHRWGPEQHEYEENTGAHMSSWRDCERKNCCGWWETYHYAANGRQRVIG